MFSHFRLQEFWGKFDPCRCCRIRGCPPPMIHCLEKAASCGSWGGREHIYIYIYICILHIHFQVGIQWICICFMYISTWCTVIQAETCMQALGGKALFASCWAAEPYKSVSAIGQRFPSLIPIIEYSDKFSFTNSRTRIGFNAFCLEICISGPGGRMLPVRSLLRGLGATTS